MIGGIGPAFIVEIVEQANDAPLAFIFAEFAGVGAHGDFDGAHVADQAWILDVFIEQGESVGTIHCGLPFCLLGRRAG